MKNDGFLRDRAKRGLALLMRARLRPLPRTELAAPALVFAPHPDDETLACGGTIALKRRAGARVGIVFLTDGTASHRRLLPKHELERIRGAEGLEAARALGVEPADVFHLGFPDQRLAEYREPAAAGVGDVLAAFPGAQVFVPYSREPVSDHVAAHRIVLAALAARAAPAAVYEYPVWFWSHWPWVVNHPSAGTGTAGILKVAFFRGARMAAEFRWCVPIRDVLDLKRRALDCHRSQMQRLLPDDRWLTLSDVGGGSFLECFLQEREIFRRSIVGPGGVPRGEPACR